MHMIRIKKAGVWAFSILITMAFTGTAFAAPPIINSFTIDPQSIANNWSTAISWNTSSSTGRDLYFTCPAGITIKKSGGSSFPCNLRQSLGGDPVGWEGFTFTNVSGATQNVLVTFYPKDSAGSAYDQGARRGTITVQTSSQPILDFSISSSTIASNAPLTIVWKGQDAGGVNLQFECADSVKIRKAVSDIAVLPCGKPGLVADLPISGSLIVYPSNSSLAPVSVIVRVFPALGGGAYDGTHSMNSNFSVLPTPPPATASASSFISSATRLFPTDSFSVSWATRDSAGANIKYSCQDGITLYSVSGTSTNALPCNVPAFTSALSATGSTTLKVKNANPYAVNLGLILLPKDAAGTYFQTTSLSLNVSVLPAGTVATTPASSVPAATIVQPSATPTTANVLVPQNSITPSVTPSVKSTLPKYNFVRPLKRGSKHADVTALQKFLAQYKEIYPDGYVTGYFGPATEKALGLFQEKYGVAKKGDEGYGTVGPKTRAKLNSMQ